METALVMKSRIFAVAYRAQCSNLRCFLPPSVSRSLCCSWERPMHALTWGIWLLLFSLPGTLTPGDLSDLLRQSELSLLRCLSRGPSWHISMKEQILLSSNTLYHPLDSFDFCNGTNTLWHFAYLLTCLLSVSHGAWNSAWHTEYIQGIFAEWTVWWWLTHSSQMNCLPYYISEIGQSVLSF